MTEFPLSITVNSEDAARRLDHFLVAQFAGISRARIQEMIVEGKALVNGRPEKASYKLRAGDLVEVTSPAERPPLRAIAEDIPLEIVYEDDDLAVVNKPAGMMVHAGAGATDDERNRGTLVNALLHRFGALSGVGGELRPGIVHRLDRETSGLMIVAKNDAAHRKLAAQFSGREVNKTYLGLVRGWPKQERGTITAEISRDVLRRTRMTTRRSGGRSAVSHWHVLERIESPWGKFALVEVRIETGRTHQIRVHMSSIGHPVVGDRLYGAPAVIRLSDSGKAAHAELTASIGDANRQVGQSSAPPTGNVASFEERGTSNEQREKRKEERPNRSEKRSLRPRTASPQPGTSSPPDLGTRNPDLVLRRNFLHSARVEFLHPRTREPLRFDAALPEELAQLLRTLRHQ